MNISPLEVNTCVGPFLLDGELLFLRTTLSTKNLDFEDVRARGQRKAVQVHRHFLGTATTPAEGIALRRRRRIGRILYACAAATARHGTRAVWLRGTRGQVTHGFSAPLNGQDFVLTSFGLYVRL